MSLFNLKDPQEELARIFADSADPVRAGIEWAKNVAAQAGVDPVKDQVRFIREIRRADPSMDLKVATYLATHAA